jgi:lipopolysaccharide/colanic/teichoic acid biosynthesis glycosyltransferase
MPEVARPRVPPSAAGAEAPGSGTGGGGGSDRDTAARRESSLADVRSALSGTHGARLVRRRERRNRAMLVGTDAAALLLAAGIGHTAGADRPPPALPLALVPAWLLLLAARGAYNRQQVGAGTAELSRIVETSVRVALAVTVTAYLAGLDNARTTVLVTLPVGAVLLPLGRLTLRGVLARSCRHGRGGRRVLAVGTVNEIMHLLDRVQRSPGAGFRVTGACVPQYHEADRRGHHGRRKSRTRASHDQPAGDRRADSDRRGDVLELQTAGVPVLGSPREVLTALSTSEADTVVVTGQGVLSRHALRRLAWQLEGTAVDLYVASALTDVALPRITLHALGGMSLLHVHAPVLGGPRLLLKSVLDRLLAMAMLVPLGPVLLVLAVLIRWDSPGPALYRQERVGLAGRTFSCLKLRTMRRGADRETLDEHGPSDANEVLFKLRADPRVTGIGRILRRYSIDELPQLLNVLGGSMAIVGPRPPLPGEVAAYGNDVQRRLFVKPGMTGLWQVSGRSDLSWAESVRLDLYYVENWSPALDLSLLARTTAAVLRGRGAY